MLLKKFVTLTLEQVENWRQAFTACRRHLNIKNIKKVGTARLPGQNTNLIVLKTFS